MKYLVSLSGGKDSTACLLWALKAFPKEDIVVYYCDTKWEHASVYDYLDYLEGKLDIQINRIESEGMVNLSKRKKTMPNPVMRFCTYELKIKTFLVYVYDNFISKDIDFINITGIRREESARRADTECFAILSEAVIFDDDRDSVKVKIKTMHPIAYWSTQRVFDYHKENNIDVNPLYKRGFSRVGCYPCIFARKHDLMNMEPEYKQRLRSLESDIAKIVSKDGRKKENVKFFKPSVNKYLNPTLDIVFDDDHCVNQFGICE